MATFQNSSEAKSVEILYVLCHSPVSCPSYCLPSGSWLCAYDALRKHCIVAGSIPAVSQIFQNDFMNIEQNLFSTITVTCTWLRTDSDLGLTSGRYWTCDGLYMVSMCKTLRAR